MKNPHKYFYKDYFAGIDFGYMLGGDTKAPDETVNVIKERNKVLIREKFAQNRELKFVIPEVDNGKEEEKIINASFPLEIMYPGLVTGIGIKHETKIEGEFKLGVHFDWTYGMPVVYGSSVKGALRSALIAKVTKEKVFYDDFFLKELTGRSWRDAEVELLICDIFEGRRGVKCEDGKYRMGNKSIYDRDVFFDAVIVESDSSGRILCSDSITPHGDNPLKNPTPHTFLKIAPGCKLQFRFSLKPTNSEFGDVKVEMSVDDKKELFQKILTTIGIGAKTNVGYGQLKEV